MPERYRSLSREELIERLLELEARRADGERTPLEAEQRAEPLVHRDADRVEAAQRRLGARDRYAELYELAPIGYLTLDPFGVVMGLNPAAAGLLRRPRDELVGLPLLEHVHPEHRDAFLRHMLRCREGESPVVTELELQPRPGERLAVELYTRRSQGAAPSELLTAMRDLTERNHSRAERDRLALEHARQRAAGEAKRKFLAMLSHELRTPLTPILATVTALQRKGDLPPQLGEVFQMIRRNVELEARLVDDLLDLTRIEHQKLLLQRAEVDVHAVVQRILQDARALPGAGSVQLDAELAAERHHVEGDPARLSQVFWNVLGNALKFTPAGGRVRLLTRNPGPHELDVVVEDSGIGIPPDRLGLLFRPFAQLGQDRGRGHSGLGLGLAIARSLVEAHGGEIRAVSPGEGQGTTLTVTLHTVEPTPDGRRRGALGRPAASAAQAHGRPGRPPVLLVEDHPDTADALAQLLGLEGFEVAVASSVREALERAREEPLVLISDIALPDGSGLELMRELRLQGREVAGIVLSGYATADDVQKSLEAGFREHLAKPVDVEALLAALRRLGVPDL